MALYAIGDFHLSFTVHKPMDVFGAEWKNHTEKIRTNWLKMIKLEFLQNNFYIYEDYALVGTKEYCDEGRDTPEQLEKLLSREEARLRMSFELAKAAGYRKYIMFLHYPPTSIYETESRFTRMAEEYDAKKVIYSHCHGRKRYGDSIRGYKNGIEYKLVSSDYLGFKPERIL